MKKVYYKNKVLTHIHGNMYVTRDPVLLKENNLKPGEDWLLVIFVL